MTAKVGSGGDKEQWCVMYQVLCEKAKDKLMKRRIDLLSFVGKWKRGEVEGWNQRDWRSRYRWFGVGM